LRSAKSIINFGIIEFESNSEENISGSHIASSVYAGIKFGYELIKKLTSIENAIVFEN